MSTDRAGDRILLEGVSAYGYHGVLADEKRDGQTFVVDVLIHLDAATAGRSDDLHDTVSYAEVAGQVVARITGPSFDLIERLAEVVADDVLDHALVDAVEVVVHKPQAPVGHPFTDVQVRVVRENAPRVVVALGANLGDRGETLAAAVDALRDTDGLTVTRVSPVVETDPVGGPEQPPYLNAVVVGRSTMAPDTLLARLHEIEAEHGRTREIRWGARTLDLDLIAFGAPGSRHEVTSDDPTLTLPHPRAHERAFVLVPWHDADPGARLRVGPGPDGIRSVADLLDGLDATGVRALPGAAPLDGPVAVGEGAS
ncbi:2-amino-4-hydroxy-6-hydroxymethyldihydropteridine diphosphokinase [Terracoccus luteus]|uniref:Bifunctional folate synthesis protein n=1 Tax=Terracoccus luteus TaxID=53356 RepID=A0A839PU01_9MICO|nr:2-amino-4-hydroxy-6-hydroxymethyldihydropteridine diphosphokinase [Terracoccus luteus]MBB2986234.1 dihydroneopterin aldolase/2-amino-4-hydroxy-6-hydroxymethyldihydropteridine diphosphokinase [Terracoccus luteus]MCP2172176.1 dihydroneopterin aldolase/2-amino-4-hydroxy-6-hydroxymethyldihydropteridine diphosphokinase [Terracoccus luteus]